MTTLSAKNSSLWPRILTSLVLIPSALFAVYAGGWVLALWAAAAGLAMAREWVKIVHREEAPGWRLALHAAAILGSQGWKQLPSRYHGDRGIGGLFLREVRGGGGFECIATESLANGAPYEPAVMADTHLAGEIAQLYELGALSRQIADELMRGLHEGPSFFRKELWRHDLTSGLTTICDLGRKGEKGRSVTRSNARIIAALYLSLAAFDRHAVYLGAPPLDSEE